ncbi:MAG: hypothetical protein ACHQX1_01775, partial [Candidatus Micrarchaeales archaeon]
MFLLQASLSSIFPILDILILILTFAISIWNGYASGFNIGMCRKNNIEGFQKYASYSGLGLAFVGMTYALVIVLSILAYYTGYIDIGTVEAALSINFLVFGLLIIGFGIMVTIQSILIAAQRKSFWSILVAIWNIFAMIVDIASYISGFKEATSMLGGQNRRDQGSAVMIVLIAILISFFIVHAAYRFG